MAGHGGDEFLKYDLNAMLLRVLTSARRFQDQEEITSQDLADAFEQMAIQRRFNEILFIIDTCQASTMHNRFKTRNVMSIGSSAKSENSYSHHSDANLGVSVIDRFTFYALEFLEKHLSQSARLSKTRSPSLQDFVRLPHCCRPRNVLADTCVVVVRPLHVQQVAFAPRIPRRPVRPTGIIH